MASLLDKYNKEQFTQFVQESTSYRDLAKKLGYQSFSGTLSKQLQNKMEFYNLSYNDFKSNEKKIIRTFNNIFIENSTVDQKTLRKWYKKGSYSEYKCSICGLLPIWQGKELTLILDHINGCNTDDRLENLRWVCPNCNMQLPTTNGKNLVYKKLN